MIDPDGYIHVMSRSDDIINVAAHRFSTGTTLASFIHSQTVLRVQLYKRRAGSALFVSRTRFMSLVTWGELPKKYHSTDCQQARSSKPSLVVRRSQSAVLLASQVCLPSEVSSSSEVLLALSLILPPQTPLRVNFHSRLSP